MNQKMPRTPLSPPVLLYSVLSLYPVPWTLYSAPVLSLWAIPNFTMLQPAWKR